MNSLTVSSSINKFNIHDGFKSGGVLERVNRITQAALEAISLFAPREASSFLRATRPIGRFYDILRIDALIREVGKSDKLSDVVKRVMKIASKVIKVMGYCALIAVAFLPPVRILKASLDVTTSLMSVASSVAKVAAAAFSKDQAVGKLWVELVTNVTWLAGDTLGLAMALTPIGAIIAVQRASTVLYVAGESLEFYQ